MPFRDVLPTSPYRDSNPGPDLNPTMNLPLEQSERSEALRKYMTILQKWDKQFVFVLKFAFLSL